MEAEHVREPQQGEQRLKVQQNQRKELKKEEQNNDGAKRLEDRKKRNFKLITKDWCDVFNEPENPQIA